MIAAVVIPVYKSGMDEQELISFTQVCKILKNYPIIVVCPVGLNLSAYYDIYPKLLAEYFEPVYFNDIASYNQLLLSCSFYSRLKKYKYILIYQLDAFVFRDELEYWCSQGYDYIGAPIFEHYDESIIDSKVLMVGNGGFSLRKVKKCLLGLKYLRIIDIKNNKDINKKNKFFLLLKELCNFFSDRNQPIHYIKTFKDNEDVLWSFYLNKELEAIIYSNTIFSPLLKQIIRLFKIASIEAAAKFSFECNPSLLYKLNNNELPFGCHAWWRYDLGFWEPHIKGTRDNFINVIENNA